MTLNEHPPFEDLAVRAVFAAYPQGQAERMLTLRRWVFESAEDLGLAVTEALRWGQPAYLCNKGSTLRMDAKSEGACSLFVNCQTDLVAQFKERHGDSLELIGTRQIRMPMESPLPESALRDCISLTLTYKMRKKK
jgi:hypothetical protein